MITIATGHNDGITEKIQRFFVFDFDIQKSPYFGDTCITNLQDFQKAKLGKGVKTRQLPKLLALKKGLQRYYSNTVDPIEYILYLYYSEELSSYEVLEKCQKFGLPYKNQSAFVKFMTGTLRWELRDNKEMTERRIRKISSERHPSIKGLRRATKELIEGNRERYQNALASVFSKSQIIPRKFSAIDLKSIKNNSDKVFYILECFEGISFQNLCFIVDESGLGAKVLADICNKKLKEIHENNPEIPLLSISQGSIHRLLKIHGLRE